MESPVALAPGHELGVRTRRELAALLFGNALPPRIETELDELGRIALVS